MKEALKTFDFPDELWAKVLFDGAIAYRNGIIKNAESLIPLYFAKTADFVIKTLDLPTVEAEKLVRKRAKVFLQEKDYLIERWFG